MDIGLVYSTLINNFMCIPDVLLKLDKTLQHSLHFRCFLNLSFLSRAWSTCGKISMAPSFLNRLHQVLSVLIIIYHLHHHMALQPNLGPGLPFWGFVIITFLQGWTVSPAPNPQPGGPGLGNYDPPETGWPSYTPRHWVPILVAFYDMHGLQWDYSLILATT
jgi:hypothetical protein